MRPGDAKSFNRFPCSWGDRDLERVAEQPTETGGFTGLCDNALKKFGGGVLQNAL